MSQQNGTFGGSVKAGLPQRKKLVIGIIIAAVVLAGAGAGAWWFVRNNEVSQQEEATPTDERIKELDKAVTSAESKDQKAGLLYFKAQAYESEGDLAAAASTYEQMLQQKPSAGGYQQLARTYQKMGRLSDARVQYQKAIEVALPEEKQYYQDQLKEAGV